MAVEKLDISSLGAKSLDRIKVINHIKDVLIPGCEVGNIRFDLDGTVQVDIYIEKKKLGHLVLITEKREQQREAKYSNSVLKYLLYGSIALDRNREIAIRLTVDQLKSQDLEFAKADEALQAQLEATDSTNPLKEKFEYSLERCQILWSRLRMSRKDERGRMSFTINNSNGSFTRVVLNEQEIAPYADIEPYTKALNAMTALLKNPQDRQACIDLKEQIPMVVGGNNCNKRPVVGWILVGIGLLFAIIAISSGVSIPFIGDFVFLRLLSAISGIVSFISLTVGSIAWMNASDDRRCARELTGFFDAVEAVEALQKNELYRSNSALAEKGDKNSPHPAGNPNAYHSVVERENKSGAGETDSRVTQQPINLISPSN